MNIAELKQHLGIKKFELRIAKDADGNKTEFANHWDGGERVSVGFPLGLVKKMVEGEAVNIEIRDKSERVSLSNKPYTSIFVTEMDEIDFTV